MRSLLSKTMALVQSDAQSSPQGHMEDPNIAPMTLADIKASQ
jgi:hypothetical protein